MIGPIFFKNIVDHIITVNGAHYRDMKIRYFVAELQDMDVDGIWVQQNKKTI